MFRFPRWKIASIVAMSLAALLIIMPSFLSKATFEQARSHLPKWIPFQQVVLGLDLQGGAHILLEVDQNDVIKTLVGNLRDDSRRIVREENVRSLTGGYGVQGRTVQFRIADASDRTRIMPRLRQLGAGAANAMGGVGAPSIEMTTTEDGMIRMTVTDVGLNDKMRRAVDQGIEVIRRRVDALESADLRHAGGYALRLRGVTTVTADATGATAVRKR
jgi:preprotein translocase subunit SecD